MSKKVIITSGFFNPVHIGHINLVTEAKKLGDYLVVIVNNDEQVKMKGSTGFMPESERAGIIKTLRPVDEVFLSIDKGLPIHESLRAVVLRHPDSEFYFAKGGDRNIDNIPKEEQRVCEELHIKVVSGVGGSKVQSSSWLINNVKSKPT